ncbi:thioredoxin family protein [Polaribacter sp. Z014]|uniref:thioredoxin family protein n=1 Tax=Polaribacter sp. Z014 TaxID=2927126 RepID=UPI002021CD05|nr:thioredoxin family protein [Polaribacter sp. Z014]MCL7764612.1 thioredoxin family protein [Polaribacter sp. Z014]
MKTKFLALFITSLFAFNQQVSAQESTKNLLENAQELAKKEGKSIFIKFEASWCSWCHKMTKDMQSKNTKKFFDDNYVIVPIVVKESAKNRNLENPGSLEVLKKYNGDKAGLPFWLILDANLKVITDSNDANNQNLGAPGSAEEVAVFIKKIKKSAKKVTQKDIENITNQFVMKK